MALIQEKQESPPLKLIEEEKKISSPDPDLQITKYPPLLGAASFETIYKSFQNLVDVIKMEGNEIIINRKNGTKKPTYTPLTREIERDLYDLAKQRNFEGIKIKLNLYFSQYCNVLDDSLKYILLFYKVFFGKFEN